MRLFLFVTLTFLWMNVSLAQDYTTFTSVKEAISSKATRIKLNLSGQGIEKLPPNIFKITNLVAIELSNNKSLRLVRVCKQLQKFTSLESLTINNSNLVFMPNELFELTSLKYLNLSQNDIATIPENISQLSELKELNLSKNKIIYIQPGIKNLSKLHTLSLNNNGKYAQKVVFIFLGMMKNLKTLSIDASEGLFEEIENLTLNHLILHKTNLPIDASTIGSISSLTQLTLIRTLSINYPSFFLGLKNLHMKKLSIQDNGIIQLDERVSLLEELEELELSGWNINLLPAGISKLSSLESLSLVSSPNFHFNQLATSLAANSALTKLNLIGCNLAELPSGVAQLKNLQELNVSNNKLTSFPATLADNPSLKQLVFYNNTIDPVSINHLESKMQECQFLYEERSGNVTASISNNVVRPPVEKLDVKNEVFSIDPSKQNVLTYSSGSEIKIPKDAFVDENGNVITGKVELAYREFNDPLEIIFSGIPMGYDSAGSSYNFSSSGMIEIRATQNGKEVFPNKNSPIQIDMVSNNSSNAYNMYYFNENEDGWELRGNDSITTPDTASIVQQNFPQIEYNGLGLPRPYLPVKQYSVDLNFENTKRKGSKFLNIYPDYMNYDRRFDPNKAEDTKSYSEFGTWRKYNWKLDHINIKQTKKNVDSLIHYIEEYNQKRRKWYYSSTQDTVNKEYNLLLGTTLVDDVWMTPNYKTDNFLLNFLICGDTTSIPIIPHISSRNPKIIQRRYKLIYTKYFKALASRRARWAELDLKHGDYLEKYQEEMIIYQEEVAEMRADRTAYFAKLRREIDDYQASAFNITRSFRVTQFGYWNSDVIRMMKQPRNLIAKMYDEELNGLKVKEIFIADISTNGVRRYTLSSRKKYYDAQSKNAIIAILQNDEIALLAPSKFKKDPLYKNASKPKLEVFKIADVSIGELKKRIGM